jgi:hypothetical protein
VLTYESKRVSFNAIFRQFDSDGSEVKEIEIPLIQRDYAQGRQPSPAIGI